MKIELEEIEKEWCFGRDCFVMNIGEGTAAKTIWFARDGKGGLTIYKVNDGDYIDKDHIAGLILWLKQNGDI
jgi:hypothetical protein